MQRQMPDLVAKHAQNGESYEALKLEYESLKADHVQEKASVDSIRSEKDALNRKRAQIDSQISHYRRKCQQHETEFKDSRKLYERAQEVFEDQEQQCLRFCDRIPTKRTESEIRSEIRKLEALVKQAEEEYDWMYNILVILTVFGVFLDSGAAKNSLKSFTQSMMLSFW